MILRLFLCAAAALLFASSVVASPAGHGERLVDPPHIDRVLGRMVAEAKAVGISPPVDATEASGALGEFFWAGLTNTLFWVDPKNAIVAVLFTQSLPPGGTDLHKRFRDAVYHRATHEPAVSVAR